jgi:spermidine synthase
VREAAAVPARDRLLFAVAIACSAFLVFLVQPMVAKRLLPWYGGAPGVWALCLAFYQTTLFAGYAYAHALMRLGRPQLELGVHGVLFAAALVALPVLPGELWRPEASSNATSGILLALAANVALPFLFLSATGPLLQAWFGRAHPARSPYFLYALSNLGSMLALFAYPFGFEPNLGLAETGSHWSLAFAVVGAAILGCGALMVWQRRNVDRNATEQSAAASPSPSKVGDIALWMALSGVAVVLLMGITNQLCLDIASVPFLWILPLSVYLLTFIICFSSERVYQRWPLVVVAMVVLLLLPLTESAFTPGGELSLLQSRPVAIALYLLLLFAACMVVHGELYRRRPAVEELTSYYLWVSAGGALGGLFVGLGAERWFSDYYEVPLGFALWCALVLGLAMRDRVGFLGLDAPLWRKAVAVSLASFLLLSMLSDERFRTSDVVHQERSFFGVLRVLASDDGSSPAHVLRHGTTLHGLQFTGSYLSELPTSYYGFAAGVGLTLAGMATADPIRVGVVGLGAGTLAAYGRPGDLYRFYEIDPSVISLARDSQFFSFLGDSKAEIEVVEGDGRLSLEAEAQRGEPGWDLLVLDAFSSDAIPVHLLTREAFALYAKRLAPDGLMAFHVSNRHLALAPLAFRLARSTGLAAAEVRTESAPKLSSVRSRWVLVAHSPQRLAQALRAVDASRLALGLAPSHLDVTLPEPRLVARVPVWTDDYSDLMGILRQPR